MIVPGSANALMLGQSQGYNLTKSLRFRSSASAYLNRTPASAGNRKTWTWSAWIKRGAMPTNYPTLFMGGTTLSDTGGLCLLFGTNGNLYLQGYSTNFFITNQLFRDPSAWYHIVVAFDTTQSTASNRVRLYVNGLEVTSWNTYNNLTQNTDYGINQAALHTLGYISASGFGNNYFDGYMTEVNFVDGQALTPSSFGSNNAQTGVWQPKKYSGTYGTNGFYLPFTNTTSTTTLGYDFSGNSNNWTTNNLSLTSGSTYDSMTDVPTLTSTTTANYCTLNPLNASSVGAANNANLQAYSTSGANTGAAGINGTMALPTTGQYYFEVTMSAVSNAGLAGIAKLGATQDTNFGAGAYANIYAYTNTSGVAYANNSTAYTGSTLTTGDVLGVAVDMTNGALYFAKNNTWQNSGVPTSGATKTGAISFTVTSDLLPTCYAWKNSGADALSVNFGQRPFTYTPPTGYKTLNTYNLPTPTIGATASTQANKYMDVSLYTGTGSSQTIVNSGAFKPDLVWDKVRSTAGDHRLVDSVRGVNLTLESDNTSAEFSESSVTAFNSNGFTAGSAIGASGQTFVAWQWQAGQGTTSSNTSGSITSTVSVNASAGFSVVTYTGTGSNATVGHGLGVAPNFVIYKNRTTTTSWCVYVSQLGNTGAMILNSTTAFDVSSTYFNNTSATSSTLAIGSSAGTNGNTNGMVAYCWTEIAGFSKFGSYTGNGSTDGPFVYTGFRPKYVLFKNASAGSTDWIILDSVRDTYNVEGNMLFAELSIAEVSSPPRVDFLSNGFKLRTSSQPNDSSNTIIYAAFAENPFKYSLAR